MRAILVSEFGGPEVLKYVELADPVPGPHEVLVKLEVIDVTQLDASICSGEGLQPQTLPFIPGRAGAGVIISAGSNVDSTMVGSRVVVRTHGGCYAEKVCCKISEITYIPDSLDFLEATALIHDGVDAALLVEEIGVYEDDWVLVIGASSGTGYMLARAAMRAGGNVVGVGTGRAQLSFMLEQQIEHVIDHNDSNWFERAKALAGENEFTVVMDGVGGTLGTTAIDLIRRGGCYLNFSHNSAPKDTSQFVEWDGYVLHHYPPYNDLIKTCSIRTCMDTLALDKWTQMYISITGSYLLEQASSAHQQLGSEDMVGKLLILVEPQPA